MANENIESQLGAYIDGLLDAQQREVIEQYLDRYPEHRKLIDAMIQERALLRDLPREKAPEDVLTHFQEQLERSVLLEDFTNGNVARETRGSRWSLAALLTLIMLIGGASVIIWIAMPPKRGRQTENVVVPDTLPATTVAVEEPATQPAPEPAAPKISASVIAAGDQIIVMIISDDLAAARNRAEHFLASEELSHSHPPAATEPTTTQSATTSPVPTMEVAWVIPGMTLGQANELAQSFSEQPSTSPAESQSTTLSTQPTTQPEPTSQPASQVILIFKQADLAATQPVESKN
ncbi:MAG TPA: hypothetical protein VGG19_03845 [Tepidisphaeraceae bacterium]|jgi:anti-sigma factor RsiW